jgi:hypothetical protein
MGNKKGYLWKWWISFCHRITRSNKFWSFRLWGSRFWVTFTLKAWALPFHLEFDFPDNYKPFLVRFDAWISFLCLEFGTNFNEGTDSKWKEEYEPKHNPVTYSFTR